MVTADISPQMSPLTNAGLSFCMVLVLAIASFRLIELPCLSLKKPLTNKIRSLAGGQIS